MNEARWLSPDVVYLVFLRGGAVSGARVGGQIWSPPADPDDPMQYTDPRAVARYLAADPASPQFLARDRKNFRHASAELADVRLSGRRSLWTAPLRNSGSIRIVPRVGRARRLVLLGRQQMTAVQQGLEAIGAPLSSRLG